MAVEIRPYTLADWEGLFRVQRESFPPPYPAEQLWSREQIARHVERFPEGALCAVVDGEIVGSSTSLIVRFDPDHPDHTWAEISGDGSISTHDPSGDSLYGIDVAVRPSWRGRGVARALYEARYNLVRRLGLKRFLAAGRMPGYHRMQLEMTPDEYARAVMEGRLIDPVITPQLRAGLRPVGVLRNYLSDAESVNNALLLQWVPDGSAR